MTVVDDLARRAARGETDALQQLLIRSEPDLHRFALRTCRSEQDAQDAVQHALIVVYTRIGTFRAAARFTTWIFTVISHQCQRLARQAAKYVHVATPLPEPTPRARIDEFERVDLLAVLIPAIAALPNELRTVFVLRDIEDLDTATTATMLDISEANVKVRLHRARTRLREHLAPPRNPAKTNSAV